MAAGNGVKFSLTPVKRSTGPLDVCPFLRLASDPNTSALYVRSDHRCVHLGREPLSAGWQRRYCLTDAHRTCPYFLGEGAATNRPRGKASFARTARRFAPIGVIGLTVLLVLVLIGLVTNGAAGFDVLGRLSASTEEDGRVLVSQPALSSPQSQSLPQELVGRAERGGGTGGPVTGLDGSGRFADDLFSALWMRTDAPIAELEIERTWVWGPEPLTRGTREAWTGTPDGERLVQYFPKGRMERSISNLGAGQSVVSSGLLVSEMVEGNVQTGPEIRLATLEPLDVPIAGDSAIGGLPTYAEINELGLMELGTRHTTGDIITETIVNGTVESSFRFSEWAVTAAGIDAESDHSVASVFQDYFDSVGTIHEDGEYTSGELFDDPTQLFGVPITEAYWARVEVDREPIDLLWQCFERRCLTYTPSNDPGWRVESGNAGSHYVAWRYGEPD